MNILGIHFDASLMRTCLLRKKGKRLEIIELKESSHVNPIYTKNFKGRIATGLSAKKFLIRSMEIKVASQRHINETIAFQIEALSPFKSEEVITVPFIEKKEPGKAEVLLFTVPREGLKEHFTELEKLKIDPDTVSTISSALCHFVRWKFPDISNAFIIDLGTDETTCVSLENGKLKKSHAIFKGINQLLEALYEDRKKILLRNEIEAAAKQIDLLLLKPGLNPHLSTELTELRQEIAKIYHSFGPNGVKELIFTGNSEAFIHLKQYLFESTSIPKPLSIEEQKFAVSIGLALEQVSSRPIQLRLAEFFPQKNWKKLGLLALILLSASVFFSGALFMHAERTISLRKAKIFKASGIQEKEIDEWISVIEANAQEYPYILQAPKVSSVLTWLSSHPLIEQFKNENDPLDLREFKYQLVGFPKIHSEEELFRAKVEIEFSFKNMLHARKFHEALRQNDEWVDRNAEITWEALSDGYRVCFYLLNRSAHES